MLPSALSDPAFPFSLPVSRKFDKSLQKTFDVYFLCRSLNKLTQRNLLEARTTIRGKVSRVDKVSKKLQIAAQTSETRPFFSSFFLSSGAAAASALTLQE